MYLRYLKIGSLVCFSLAAITNAVEKPTGTVKAGYVVTDEEGNNSVYQPGYNIYEGFGLSLEDFSYKLDNGTKFFGDLKNITLPNRNLMLGAGKTGLFNLRLSHNEYRRQYSFEGDQSTKRKNSNASFWVQAHKNVRLFGGYGQVNKSGRSLDLYEPAGFVGQNNFDYSQKYYHSGLRFGYSNSYLELNLRGSDYNDGLNSTNDRKSLQYRVTGSAPVPKAKGLYVNGGFQHYDLELPNIADTLTANTGWGGLRYFHEKGYYAKYSFIWDRARTSTDLAATDNITNSLYLGKEWRSLGGVTVGYSYKINDDINDELQTDAVHLSGWYKPHRQLTLRAGYGTEISNVESGTTLTGDKDITRYNASGTYKFKQGTWRAKFERKETDNKDIGSTVDFTRVGTDIAFNVEVYGDFVLSYDYLDGSYENSEGTFQFNDHVLWGDFLSRRYRDVQFGFGCTYVRSLEDLDVENFSLKFSGNYIFSKVNKVELIYTVHNFDDFDDPSPVYSRYYTANFVEISLSRGF